MPQNAKLITRIGSVVERAPGEIRVFERAAARTGLEAHGSAGQHLKPNSASG
jgi:hypothetical protein